MSEDQKSGDQKKGEGQRSVCRIDLVGKDGKQLKAEHNSIFIEVLQGRPAIGDALALNYEFIRRGGARISSYLRLRVVDRGFNFHAPTIRPTPGLAKWSEIGGPWLQCTIIAPSPKKGLEWLAAFMKFKATFKE